MITLTTSGTLDVTTSSANAVHVHASWADHDHTPVTDYVPDGDSTTISSATTTTVVPSPTTFPKRTVKHLTIRAAGGANTVTVLLDDGTTMISVALLSGETLEYEDAHGWKTLTDGALKGIGSTGATGATGATGTVELSHAPFVTLAVVTNAVDIDLATGGIFELELDDDATTVTMSGETTSEANFFTLRLAQDTTGGWAFTPPASWIYSTGAYTVSSAADAVDLIQGISYDDGTTWLISYLKDYV